MSKKVFIKTFGCQMNEYDSDKMTDVLHAADGYVATLNMDEADLILFNTCSVREKAQEKVFSDLGRYKHLKERGVLIGVGGCVASQEGEEIIKRAPYVDVVFGPQTLHRLPQMIELRRASGASQVDISFPEIEKFDHMPPAKVDGASAFVSIMEGCSKYCSYCVVPYTRGEEVSRRFEDVLTEVAGLAAQGVKEITLLGQNVNAYRGAMEGGEIADFALLLEYVADIPGIERMRFVTSHPKEFTQRLIDAYAKIPQLVDHLYLPAQHGSDKILGAMKRGYTGLEYKSIIRRIRAVRPNMAISSDFIVGFPGETQADFESVDAVDASFEGCDLNNTKWRRAKLASVSWRGCKLTGASFEEVAHLGASFEDCLLIGADLRGFSFRKATLKQLDFSEAYLAGCDFRDAVFEGGSLRNAVLKLAKFQGADLRGADIDGFKLTEAALFKGAVITHAQAANFVRELGISVI